MNHVVFYKSFSGLAYTLATETIGRADLKNLQQKDKAEMG
jgi:hypothetical protein